MRILVVLRPRSSSSLARPAGSASRRPACLQPIPVTRKDDPIRPDGTGVVSIARQHGWRRRTGHQVNRFPWPVLGKARYWRTVRIGGRAFLLAAAAIFGVVISGVVTPGTAKVFVETSDLELSAWYAGLILLQTLICLHGLVFRAAGMSFRQTWPLTVLSTLIAAVVAIAFHAVQMPSGSISMVGLLLLILVRSEWVWAVAFGIGLFTIGLLWWWSLPESVQPDDYAIAQGAVFGIVGAIAVRATSWLAIRTAELAAANAEIARLTVHQERTRISRDLHDRLGHNLVSIMLRTELAERLAAADRLQSERESRAAHRLARQTLQDMRNIAHGTLVADLDAELAAAIDLLESRGAVCQIRIGEQPEGAAAEVLAWVLRESVTNILRHSQPVNCTLELVRIGDRFEFMIGNDGLLSSESVAPGHGLGGIAERVERIGGTCSAESTGDRFVLRVTLPAISPVPEDAPADE
ncbi:sensor histidine kinase [Streptomyces sp. AA4]|uniref:sensor histidine kinase n=1 Tax=Streptomyces sp. AA4 TaxID=591158 RepID=UPI00131A3386|nr:histidine kinase [Streptomyces sp. AA4]